MCKRVRRKMSKLGLIDRALLTEKRCPAVPKPFSSDDDLLGKALQLFEIRQAFAAETHFEP